MSSFGKLIQSYKDKNLILRILVGVAVGAVIGFWAQKQSGSNIIGFIGMFGDLFVGALKAVAPVLVFILIAASILTKTFSNAKGLKRVVFLYILGTFLASCVGVITSFLFPTTLVLNVPVDMQRAVPASIVVVLKDLLFKIVDNPVHAISTGNYMGILAWAIGFGIALRYCTNETKKVFSDLSDAITSIVKFIIQLAPFGIMGLVATSVYSAGGEALFSYLRIIIVLVCSMAFVAVVLNPLIVWVYLRKNPYPLVFTCLKESGVTAFFTRSSAANIPVNLNLCRKLGLDEELYPISIPLGATINMAGAAVVIAILTLSAVNTLGIQTDFGTALLLCLLAAVGACGASGVAGGSLMLIPLAASLFNISNDIAMQVVAIGFIIGVIQDSVETAINSSTDVLFTAVASYTTSPHEDALTK
ncbi:serine/threonine transporter SstT [Campylobacter geochelonis]|uniref:Serine/threonine transporter SstT n=1 Tax=Campylobacter geochelonis TaxID=1780362 RepID=A0A128EFR3_9BACT|nr:serine/threonine transporter SstT [Campylobacter geochelonis]QKF70956.1 sodium ion-motive force-driven serine/threonine transporter [Campylobacter geochelonis]CZE47033.1 serine/threonine transporter SstT [Campylobacter geochelonis]